MSEQDAAVEVCAEPRPTSSGAVNLRPDAVGLGWRPELAADLLAAPERVDFVEVVAETCHAQPAARREALALRELWPVVPHGVKLSLGSADGLDLERARALGRLARELRAPALSEHAAFTRAAGREIGHLTSLPFTREAVRVVARNVAAARRLLPDVPLLLENVAWTLRWPEDAMSEGDFHHELTRATGCGLLLDLGNVYANARNAGLEPLALLRSYPLEAVAMLHLAGGACEHGFYADTHAHAVPEAVFELLDALFAARGPLPLLLERDAGFPPFAELEAELRRVRALAADAGTQPARATHAASAPPADTRTTGDDGTRLRARQADLALLLTQRDAPAASQAAGFGLDPLARTRAVLLHKRVDDALPLLPRACGCADELRALALDVLARSPRPARGVALADALAIAARACADARFESAARLDLLELRARFGPGALPRLGPYFGRARQADGRSVWAFKAAGRHARVRLFQMPVGTRSGQTRGESA